MLADMCMLKTIVGLTRKEKVKNEYIEWIYNWPIKENWLLFKWFGHIEKIPKHLTAHVQSILMLQVQEAMESGRQTKASMKQSEKTC